MIRSTAARRSAGLAAFLAVLFVVPLQEMEDLTPGMRAHEHTLHTLYTHMSLMRGVQFEAILF